MKIIQIVTQMEAAGAQKVAFELAKGLRTRGHHSELWFLYTKRPAYDGLPHVRSFHDRRPGVLTFPAVPTKIFSALRKAAPDVLITHTHYASVIGQPLAALCGIGSRIAVQHSSPDVLPKAARALDRILGESPIYQKIVCVSDNTNDSFRFHPASYRSKIVVIPNGVEKLPILSPFDARLEWNVPDNARLLVSVARLSAQKNHRVLLRAMVSIPEAFLLLVGEGELRKELMRMTQDLGLSDRVRFTGELTSDKVGAVLANADLFVFPSLFEAMPLAAIEALYAGIPIVGSDIPSLREVLGSAMETFSATDSEGLVRAIRAVLENDERAKELRRASLDRSALWQVSTMVDRYENLIRGRTI